MIALATAKARDQRYLVKLHPLTLEEATEKQVPSFSGDFRAGEMEARDRLSESETNTEKSRGRDGE